MTRTFNGGSLHGKIVNLTANITVKTHDGGEIKPSGCAKVNAENRAFTILNDISISKRVIRDIQGLPVPSEKTFYIVSDYVVAAAHAIGRTTDDLLVPTMVTTDENGIVSASGLRLAD